MDHAKLWQILKFSLEQNIEIAEDVRKGILMAYPDHENKRVDGRMEMVKSILSYMKELEENEHANSTILY